MKKIYSLRENHIFNDVLKTGNKINNGFLLMSKKQCNKNDSINFGISVPKKLGNAVFRNHQKRQIKSIIGNIIKKDQIILESKVNLVILVKKPFTELDFQKKEILLKEYIQKIIKNGKSKWT